MPRVDTVEYAPYTPQQLYTLVLDVERYPEFLPWCKAARILSHQENYFEAELMISFKHIRESYVSRVQGDAEQPITGILRRIRMVDAIFIFNLILLLRIFFWKKSSARYFIKQHKKW
jgi:ribosome-associated toxin RatA of RatAB toxin-antitoxin module